MGPTLRSFIAPGHDQEFKSSSFEASYFGDVPLQVAHQTDQILIDWITQKKTPESCVSRMNSVIDELKTSDVPAACRQMTDLCLGSLECLAIETLPNPDKRRGV